MSEKPWEIVDKLTGILNCIGCEYIRKSDVYNFLMGDEHSLDKYLGDTESKPVRVLECPAKTIEP